MNAPALPPTSNRPVGKRNRKGGRTNPGINRYERQYRSCGDFAAALCPSPVDDVTTCPGRHARPKSMTALTNTVARLKCPFHCNSPVSQPVKQKCPSPSLQGLASSFWDRPCQRTSQAHPGPEWNDRPEVMYRVGVLAHVSTDSLRSTANPKPVQTRHATPVRGAWRPDGIDNKRPWPKASDSMREQALEHPCATFRTDEESDQGPGTDPEARTKPRQRR